MFHFVCTISESLLIVTVIVIVNHITSLRAMFGTNILSNAVHGASDADSANEELKIIFGEVEFDEDGW